MPRAIRTDEVRSETSSDHRARVAFPLVGGLLGATLVALGNAFNTPMMPAGPFGVFNAFHHLSRGLGPEFLMALRASGLMIWMAAWYAARHLSKRHLALVLVTWLMPLVLLPPGAGDLYNYVQQGWVVLHGGDPTVIPAGQMHGPFDAWAGWWKNTTVGYPPLALAVQAAMVALAGTKGWLALMFMRIPALVGLGLVWVCSQRIAPRLGLNATRAVWVAALNPYILWQGVMCGHQDMIAAAVALLAAHLLMGSWRRALLGLLVLVLAVAIKPTSAVAACIAIPSMLGRWPSLNWRGRQLLTLIGSGLTVALPMAVVAVLSTAMPFGREWTHPTGDPSRHSSSLYSAAVALEAEIHSASLSRVVDGVSAHALVICTAVAGVLLLVAVMTIRMPLRAIPAICLLLVCCIGPEGRPWYLIPALFCFAFTRWRDTDIVMGQLVLLFAFSADDQRDSLAAGSYVGRQMWAWCMAFGITVAWVCVRRSTLARRPESSEVTRSGN